MSSILHRLHRVPNAVVWNSATATMVAALAIVIACGSAEKLVALSASEQTRALVASVGDEVEIALQTVGPGAYASPPGISSPALQFEAVDLVSPVVPAGPTQRFRFRAAVAATAVLTLTHTGVNAAVQDTVIVR